MDKETMIRKIIKINEELCNGCGICADACHEDAIAMIDGKAKLIRDDYCDGLGNCLPVCPTNAITFEEREAAAFDEEAVKKNQAAKQLSSSQSQGCPGSQSRTIHKHSPETTSNKAVDLPLPSQLQQWPVQIKLVPINAPYFQNADILISADCCAYAYNNFHDQFMKNHITLIGCPKLDEGDYAEKLSEILKYNEVNSITVARMEVPCCGGIQYAAEKAVSMCGKEVPLNIVTISTDGKILNSK